MIDHEVGEFSSPHRFIADNFDLRYLSDRVRNTHNFEHVFDFPRAHEGPAARPTRCRCCQAGSAAPTWRRTTTSAGRPPIAPPDCD